MAELEKGTSGEGGMPVNMRAPEVVQPLAPDENPVQIRLDLKRLNRQVEENYFLMGQLLYRVQNSRIYVEWGYERFGDYTTNELGFEERKGRYLAQTWRKLCVELGVQPATMQGLGSTHARVIATVATKESVGDWIEKARNMPVAQLAERAREHKEAAKAPKQLADGQPAPASEEAKEKPKAVKFLLFKEQQETVEKAIQLACKKAESDKPGNALTLLCAEYLATNMEQDNDAQLEWYLKLVEQRFGCKVLAFANEEAARRVLEIMARKELASRKRKQREHNTEMSQGIR